MEKKEIAVKELQETKERLLFCIKLAKPELVRKEIISAIQIIQDFGIDELKK